MEPGTRLGHFEIIEALGAGGMGEVYLAEDSRLDRKVAIKVLPADVASDPDRLDRFGREAKAAAALNHPHIAAVFDVGSERSGGGAETHFIVQEHLQGETLRELLQRGALPIKKVLALATEMAEALATAHAAGIVHRDLKPENVFVTTEGHAKILDFGLAKLTETEVASDGSSSMSPTHLGTIARQVLGTAGYMAPEQADGVVDIDHRADLFALGSVFYEMATGTRAFAGRSIAETLALIQHGEPTPVAQLEPSASPELERILRKALEKDRADRYQHADDLVVDLRALSYNMIAMERERSGPLYERRGTGSSGAPTPWSTPGASRCRLRPDSERLASERPLPRGTLSP